MHSCRSALTDNGEYITKPVNQNESSDLRTSTVKQSLEPLILGNKENSKEESKSV